MSASRAVKFNEGIVDDYTPVQTTAIMMEGAVKKHQQRIDHLFIKSILAGIQLSVAGQLVITVAGPVYASQTLMPFWHLIAGFVYPVGLVMIQLTGSELFTSNMCLAYETGFNTFAITFAQQKIANGVRWHEVFLKGIGANYLVCLAVFMSISARSIVSRVLVIWIPVWTFVSIGFEHTVADMFFMPIAIMVGAPEITTRYYVSNGIIPTVLGNYVGGGLFVGTVYWWVFGLYQEDALLAEERGEGVAVAGMTPGPANASRSRSRSRKGLKPGSSPSRPSRVQDKTYAHRAGRWRSWRRSSDATAVDASLKSKSENASAGRDASNSPMTEKSSSAQAYVRPADDLV
ncbi:uncharacterized protein L969DRAFT_96996 [Mixia osmundae IAM 14324]|uniref:Formate/nitrite transporter n=1 Tax=Mixia osmundae (strain CBS 9802 / IAM 14324 / JCM 22182 / KY 12970) TaxID=764103 RepID=G7E2Q5_MIXOS|nr:uncharacterized protein L969DRAFT_96996 [Mixia osmundae IAM 14324]KEI36980.1 hypothetical protein L969DRAFT_96996 [Mixia osmundae IAM 14324]GAA97115.1 hypothetical protein E5Q_03790 [Mixia osmundae IAM 14324]